MDKGPKKLKLTGLKDNKVLYTVVQKPLDGGWKQTYTGANLTYDEKKKTLSLWFTGAEGIHARTKEDPEILSRVMSIKNNTVSGYCLESGEDEVWEIIKE